MAGGAYQEIMYGLGKKMLKNAVIQNGEGIWSMFLFIHISPFASG